MSRDATDARDQCQHIEAARAEYLTAFAREGAASYAEHAAAAPSDATLWGGFAVAMDAFIGCTTVVDLGFRRTLRARDAKQLHLAVAWLRQGLRLEPDAVIVALKTFQFSVQGQAELRCIDGAVREHERVQRALTLGGQSVQRTFAALQPRFAPLDPRAVARWLGVADALDAWQTQQRFGPARVACASLCRPRLVLARTTHHPSTLLIVQAHDGCYLKQSGPEALRIALLRGDDVHELGPLAPDEASSALARADRLLSGVEPSAFDAALH